MSFFSWVKKILKKDEAQTSPLVKVDTARKEQTVTATVKPKENSIAAPAAAVVDATTSTISTSTTIAKSKTATKILAKLSPLKVGKKVAGAKTDKVPPVLIKPLITEKVTLTGTYLFAVQPNATRSEVKKAISIMYGVKPVGVRIMNVAGKQVRWRNRWGERKDWKKAVVSLPAGAKIDVYAGT